MTKYTTQKLLKDFQKTQTSENSLFTNNKKLIFKFKDSPESKIYGTDNIDKNIDVYNPASPFALNGIEYLPARVEKRTSENSQVVFFTKKSGDIDNAETWVESDLQRLNLQDPFHTVIDGQVIFGGVEVSFSSNSDGDNAGKILFWKTNFYRITSDAANKISIEYLFSGPKGMKDIRLCAFPDGHRIAVFARPQGKIGGRGQIAYGVASSLSNVPQTIENAQLLNLFAEDEWGGANQVFYLGGGIFGVLGHIACFTANDTVRHYYPIAFTLDAQSKRIKKAPRILLERCCLLAGDAKRDDLIDVIFPGGIALNGESARLYLGVSDAETQTVDIKNPFYLDENG